MSETPDETELKPAASSGTTWGPRLFLGTLVAVLAFFYWLLIYSGGVTGHQG